MHNANDDPSANVSFGQAEQTLAKAELANVKPVPAPPTETAAQKTVTQEQHTLQPSQSEVTSVPRSEPEPESLSAPTVQETASDAKVSAVQTWSVPIPSASDTTVVSTAAEAEPDTASNPAASEIASAPTAAPKAEEPESLPASSIPDTRLAASASVPEQLPAAQHDVASAQLRREQAEAGDIRSEKTVSDQKKSVHAEEAEDTPSGAVQSVDRPDNDRPEEPAQGSFATQSTDSEDQTTDVQQANADIVEPEPANPQAEAFADTAAVPVNAETSEPATIQPDHKKDLKIAFAGKQPENDSAVGSAGFTSLLQSQHSVHTEAKEPEAQAPADAQPPGKGEKLEWKKLLLSSNKEQNEFRRIRLCIVQKEETLESIAKRYDLNPREIALLNRLGDNDVIAGQIVYIPQ
ncbi:LysM peptidoglycan-binding domain-containing protein [Paenibacillus xerothermodurans]|uniref:LysM peptidoglycan-binding domain-containing protein n=2 Tax=Paenibacillus xerothermodurans TaxID=1977292 RepID=A0A2W1N6I4_PAEXE|nr:LysM peptidoglycan-binding domain-containing protein [Paenibacillus xerothermodurans]